MNVALTFDDGPGPWTEQLLNLLAEWDAKATFFVCGQNIPGREHILRRASLEGHEIGNHTRDHHRVTQINSEELWRSLEDTSGMIEQATGLAPSLWRAPHFDLTVEAIELAGRLGLTHVLATVDAEDWVNNTAHIANRVLTTATDGSIIDLHDGIPPNGNTGFSHRSYTVAAVALILEKLEARFVTVSDLFAWV